MLVQFSLLFDLSLFNVFLVALKTLFLTFDVQYPSPQGVCELVEEIKQYLLTMTMGSTWWKECREMVGEEEKKILNGFAEEVALGMERHG